MCFGWRCDGDGTAVPFEHPYIFSESPDFSGDLLMDVLQTLYPLLDALDLRGALFAIPGRAEGWKGVPPEGGLHWSRTSVTRSVKRRCVKVNSPASPVSGGPASATARKGPAQGRGVKISCPGRVGLLPFDVLLEVLGYALCCRLKITLLRAVGEHHCALDVRD